MIDNINDIQPDLDVYGSDGEKIGTIAGVYPTNPAAGTISQSGGSIGDLDIETVTVTETGTGPTSTNPGYTTGSTAPQTAGGMGTATATSTGFVKVKQGGILGIGTTDLYIPFSDVETVVPGESITVSCTKDECGDLYSQKPDFLNDEDSGPLT